LCCRRYGLVAALRRFMPSIIPHADGTFEVKNLDVE
jgi:hypothetical protein